MSIFSSISTEIKAVLKEMAEAGVITREYAADRVVVEPPRDPTHGDVASNAAMALAKQVGMKPRDLAAAIVDRLPGRGGIVAAEVAGPGFINLRLDPVVWRDELQRILESGTTYGAIDLGAGAAVNVEYVSANPTGPLHVGHARGAVIGDVLASLLEKAGYAVTREYYVNDAGAQVDVLARSAHLRYREAVGETVEEIPSGLYPGDYLKPVGRALADRDGDKWLAAPESAWLPMVREFAVAAMLDLIRDDLEALGIRHDRFSSERALVEEGKVEAAIRTMTERDLLYTGVLDPPKGKMPEDWEPRPQTLFRSTDFGDDVDRPLCKSDGTWTYFASDIAYHFDKFERGFSDMIDVWGVDHGGYVKRMQSAVSAITAGAGTLDVKLCQLVNLLEDGQPVKMSKRAGTFVTLRDVVDQVGKDVVRFIMLTRKNDAPLDFDLVGVTERSRDNPVFYVQYAHARHHSVLRQAAETFDDSDFSDSALMNAALERLDRPEELDLIKTMANWPRVVQQAAEAHEPHRLAYYLYDLAAAFHHLWTKGKEETSLRFIDAEDIEGTTARLALVRGMAIVIASGLAVFGVTPVEELH